MQVWKKIRLMFTIFRFKRFKLVRFSKMSAEKKLQSSVYADTKKICKEVGALLNMEFESNVLDVIGELAWKKLLLYGLDLESFHKHAKRSTITTDDVKLLVRRNNLLKEFVNKKCEELSVVSAAATSSTSTKRKRT